MTVKYDPGVIPVVTACDNNFAIMAAAFLKSIEANSSDIEHYKIYILANRISSVNKRRLEEASHLDVQFIDIKDDLLARYPLPDKVDYLPKTAYFRLLIPEIFADFPKIIYLDVDVLVLRDLAELWHLDMAGAMCLACQCFYREGHRGQQNFQKLGLDEKAPYFNSGMLVMDLEKWRRSEVREKVNSLLNNDLNDPKAMDEEALNVVLYNQWKQIDQRWNYPPHIVDEGNLPFILHYIGFKPMYYDYKTGAQGLFYRYLQGTYWEHRSEYGFIKKARIKAPFILRLYLNRILKHSLF